MEPGPKSENKDDMFLKEYSCVACRDLFITPPVFRLRQEEEQDRVNTSLMRRQAHRMHLCLNTVGCHQERGVDIFLNYTQDSFNPLIHTDKHVLSKTNLHPEVEPHPSGHDCL